MPKDEENRKSAKRRGNDLEHLTVKCMLCTLNTYSPEAKRLSILLCEEPFSRQKKRSQITRMTPDLP